MAILNLQAKMIQKYWLTAEKSVSSKFPSRNQLKMGEGNFEGLSTGPAKYILWLLKIEFHYFEQLWLFDLESNDFYTR